ncbi:hypothetical protein N7491_002365 [Penicillium cf. griseofulvum]|uniref:Uncharacterized protein n=1 Tax=Penicillium cf. griseofulvum TaxID=2972120 RepID=A0A9W9T2G5_9EURO|nr:hypothetical protein N7472_003452 [Penicillium cf. griseofulvum]KAJ5446283.1 hypothetical protein N7491_002365 [Penicillium cf. griseofulvum]KAJ5448026.1 hypothetical protein N7445_002847 [Penicillium cf. griseofulvum]
MEAITFLCSITFIIAVGVAIVQGLAFYKRYRVHLHVTSKGDTPPESLDLERYDPEGSSPIQPPPKLHRHSRLGSRNSRWPGYTEQGRQPSRANVESHFAAYRIPEEADTGTVHHFPHSHLVTPNLPATFLAPVVRATTPQATVAPPPEAPTRLQTVHD